MATKAEEIVASGQIPSNWQEGATGITEHMKGAFSELNALGENPQVPAIRFQRDDDGNVVTDDSGNPNLVMLESDLGPVMELHPLAHREQYHGLHAYRYEECSDGSIVAIYANDAEGKIQLKAFPNIEAASAWSPRDER